MIVMKRPEDFGFIIKKHFHASKRVEASGTYWQWAGGWVTAMHVLKEQERKLPPFVSGEIMAGTGVIDAALIGCNLSSMARPREPKRGERLYTWGYPHASGHLSERVMRVHYKRDVSGSDGYVTPTWIAKMENPPLILSHDAYEHIYYQPVGGGMSGSPVVSEYGEPLGILVTTNSTADLNSDGIDDASCDFVALADVYDVFVDFYNDMPNIV